MATDEPRTWAHDLIRMSANNAFVVIGIWAVLVATSLYFARELRLDALPDITSNQVQVLTRAPGLSAAEVEQRVTRPIEVAVSGIFGTLQTRSVSRSGISAVTIVFEDDIALRETRQMVLERLASVQNQLPQGVDAELGPPTGGLGEVYHFALTSNVRSGTELLELVRTRVAPLLRSVPGVVEANPWGGDTRSLDVAIDPERLAMHRVPFSAVENALAENIATVPAGALPRGAAQIALVNQSNPITPEALREIPLATQEIRDAQLRIGDVANVTVGTRPRIGAATRDGRGECVYVMVQMITGGNAREVTHAIRTRMTDVRQALPDDVQIDTIYDRAELVDATLTTVWKSLAEGGLLVCLVLFAFLGSWRAGLLVAATIPVAMGFALALMRWLGVPGNLLSLGALDFGILVDAAIVLVEHIFHRRKLHTEESWQDGVVRACGEVVRPAFFGALILTVVYIPILGMVGVDGKMFRPMAITVVLALLAALAFALTFVPAAAAVLLHDRDVPKRDPVLVRWLSQVHTHMLNLAAMYPRAIQLGAVAVLLITGLLFSRIGSELVPQLDEQDLVVQTVRRADISLSGAVAQARTMERALLTIAEVAHVTSRTGNPAVATDIMGLEQADVFIRMHPRSRWPSHRTKEDVLRDMEAAIARATPNSEPSFTQPIQMRFNELLGGAPLDVVVSVFGDDLAVLHEHAEALVSDWRTVDGIEDARVLAQADVPSLRIVPDFVRTRASGLSARALLTMIAALRFGVESATVFDGPIAVPVSLYLAPRYGRSALDIENLFVPGVHGEPLAITSLATLERNAMPSAILHENGFRRALVGFNVRGRDLGSVVRDAQRMANARARPEGTRLQWGGQYETLQAAQTRLYFVLPLVLLLVVLLLTGALRSVRDAMIVLLHIPFACTGGVALLMVRGMPLSMSAIIGFIALSGIAIMNGVVLVSDILRREEIGEDTANASKSAAHARVRAVTMTALVAMLGFVPMMLASGVGSEVQRPLATVVVGGLLGSTLVTLFLLPIVFADLRRLRVPWRIRTASRQGSPR